MSTLIAVTALRHQDLFATPNGSIYETLRGSQDGGPMQARLWCAHPPDRLTSDASPHRVPSRPPGTPAAVGGHRRACPACRVRSSGIPRGPDRRQHT